MADIYGEPTIIKTDKAIITVHRPILTEEERAKRMKEVEKAAIGLMKAVIDAKRGMVI